MRRVLFTIAFTSWALWLGAQVDFSTGSWKGLVEVDYYNPAWAFPDSGLTVGLVSLGYHHYHSGAAYRDLIGSGEQGALLDLDRLATNLAPKNQLRTRLSLQTLKAVYRKKQITLGFSHEMVLRADLNYPSGLVELYNRGNQPFIGETIELGLSGEYASYNAYSLQIGIDLGKISLAVRPKILFGHQLLAVGSRRLSLYTDPEFYALTFDTDFEIYSKGLLQFDDLNFLNYRFSGLNNWSFISENTGFALDLGGTFTMDRWHVGFGVSDLGSINWKGTDIYASKKQFDYSGTTIPDVLDLDNITIGGNLDSLRTFFDFSEKTENLQRSLPTHFRVSALFEFSNHGSIAAHAHYTLQDFAPWSFGTTVNYSFLAMLETSIVLSYQYEQINLGFGAQARLGKVRPYFSVENILQGFNPLASTNFHLRTGINLALSN